jgi:hypothetical protein
VKELLTYEQILYRPACAERNVDRLWEGVKFSGGSTYNSANGGPVLVYRPLGEPHNPQYVSTYIRKCTVCSQTVLKGLEGHLDGVQYKHVFQNVMVPTVQSPTG